MSDFFRFPHTPHLAWLGAGEPRDDKVLAPQDVHALLLDDVMVEEKVDGANLGISTTDDGDLVAQNRGSWLTPESAHPQFKSLWTWLAPRRDALIDALWPDRMLFGEWCFARHSVPYDALPDWFLGFDVYDRTASAFWDATRRNALLAALDLRAVPLLARGHHTVATLTALLGTSRVGSSPMEGLVVRRSEGGSTTARAKLVRGEFVQAIDQHWSRGPLVRNRVAASSTA